MKTQKEIFESTVKNTRFEQLSASSDIGQGIIMGYNQCQEDMDKEIQSLKEQIILKDAAYSELGNKYSHLLINKQD